MSLSLRTEWDEQGVALDKIEIIASSLGCLIDRHIDPVGLACL